MHWENKDDYDSLLNSLLEDYKPSNVTEEHLVEELAGIIWRKMRLRCAEKSSLQSVLSNNLSSFTNSSAKEALLDNSDKTGNINIKQAVVASNDTNELELLEIRERLSYCLKSEQIIEESGSYNDALIVLDKEDQNNWVNNWLGEDEQIQENEEQIEEDEEQFAYESYTASTEDLSIYIQDLKKNYENQIYELENRNKVKHHTLGKSFFYEKELNKYIRYETHLDKKFEKTLAMLLKLQDMRKESLT